MTLTIGGKNYGYQLWEDPNGQKHWNEGLAPLITPQQRITEFSYEHIPPEIDLPAAFEDWSMGAGSTEYLGSQQTASGITQITSNAPKLYNYSQNIDASWGNRLYLSPAIKADGTLTTTPNFYFNSLQYGMWCAAGIYLYKYNLATSTWVVRYTASTAITSMAESSGVLYASTTDAAYVYASDGIGTVWTVYTGATLSSGNVADLFTVRNNVLMAMYDEKAYVTINAQNGGTAWSAGTVIGNTSETTKSLAVANDTYWIFKTQGIYSWDGTTVSTVWLPKYIETNNGTSAYVWYDGLIYTVYGSRILSIDPFATTTSTLAFVYPSEISAKTVNQNVHDTLEIKGTISQITGTFSDLIFLVTNPSGGVYLIKGNPQTQVYHTLNYFGTATGTPTACYAVGPNVMHVTNPCVAIGVPITATAGNSQHIILPRADLRPEDDPYYQYATSGTITGPWMSYGARGFNKFLNRGTILGPNITAGQTIVMQYQIDDDYTVTSTLLTAIDYGINQATANTEVPFYRIRYLFTFTGTGSGAFVSGSTLPFATSTPIMVGATMHATMNPPRRRIWKPLIHLRPNSTLRDSGVDTQSVVSLRNALYSAAESRITMTDWNNNSYIVRILDIQEAQLTMASEGSYETESQVFQLSLAEVETITSQLPLAYYTQARYNQGYAYS